MSRYFPHTPYAEDQPLWHTIVAEHALARAAMLGALVGTGVFGAREAARTLLGTGPAPGAATGGGQALGLRLLRTAGTGTVWGIGIMSFALMARMWGREQIEWQDRAWRLLENKEQLAWDDWMAAGTAASLLAVAATAAAASRTGGLGLAKASDLGWKGVVGAAGSGSVIGFLGYMGWRRVGGR